jgi:hypothetical protein
MMWTNTKTIPEKPKNVAVAELEDRTAPLFLRVAVDLPCLLIDLTYGHVVRGRVVNLSVGGMLLCGADSVPVGERVLCALVREADGRSEELYANGTVVHHAGGCVGIAFDEVTPRAFVAIGEMIAAGGGLDLQPVGHPPVTPIRRRPRGRRARLVAWRAHRAPVPKAA